MPNTIATFDNIVIDRVVDAWFETKPSDGSVGDLLAVLDQITNFSINTTSETKDKTDAQGVLLKRYFTSKSVEISGENATFSLNLFATQNGTTKVVDTDVIIPRIYQATIPDSGATITLPETPEVGTFQLYGTSANGNVDVDKKFTAAAGAEPVAGATTYVLNGTTLTFPTSLSAGDVIQIKYDRKVTGATKAARVNVAGDKFPKECKATFRVLCSDLCNSEEVYALYIVFEKFQMSPDFDWTVDTESNQSFSATAFKDYCGKGQTLYWIAIADDTDSYDTKKWSE
jgi:hypothetical protein